MLKALSLSVISGLFIVAGAAADEPETGRCLGDFQREEIVFARCINLAVWDNTNEDTLMLAEGLQAAIGIYELTEEFEDTSDPPLASFAVISLGELQDIPVMLGLYGLRVISLQAEQQTVIGDAAVETFRLEVISLGGSLDAIVRIVTIGVVADGGVTVDGKDVTDRDDFRTP